MKMPIALFSKVIEVIEWNQENYQFDVMDEIRISRLLDEICKIINHSNVPVDCTELNKQHGKLLFEMLSNAINYANECKQDKDKLREIQSYFCAKE